jgi:hypothetical protein
MREKFEFRIPEPTASEYLPDDAGVGLESGIASIGPIARKLILSPEDPLFADVGRIDSEFKARSRAFFTGWGVRRTYTKAEMEATELVRGIVVRIFEPAGEECGTIYDESKACEQCGGGAVIASQLFLRPSRLPKRDYLAIATTIAGEIVVSEKFVQVFRSGTFHGADFRPLYDRRSAPIPSWYELAIRSVPVAIVAPTRGGNDPFDGDVYGEYRCPRGDTIGLNLISELWLSRAEFERGKPDIAFSRERFGARRGLLRPQPELLISPRLRRALMERGLKGLRFEVAHLK